jgi:hypothetical protein
MGAGRPRIVDDPVNFTTWVDRAVLEEAKKAARGRGIGLGQVVRQALARLARGGRRPRPRRGKTSRS